MEDLLESLSSYMEMEDDELNQNNSSIDDEQEFLKDIMLEQPECNATSPTNSILPFDEKSNSSNSIMSLERCVCSPATYLLSFDNSSVEPIIEQMSNKRSHDGVEFEPKVNQATKRVKRESEIQDHLMAERKRRKELTESIIALSAIIPGLKKMDKCYVLNEAINYTKHLQQRIKELENQNIDKRVKDPAIFIWKSQASSNKSTTSTYCERNTELLLEVEARVLEKEVLIKIHCENQNDIVLKIHELLEKFNLTITTSSILPFGASILVINIFAQMDEENSMTMDDLVKNLRKHVLEAHDRQ
ncbi:transcription factor NAI1-like isoform X2 [Cicer arietinum]|uniref:Transcription factor bHLH18-like isoform X2 n=1 Tax=Cicer arietinum TaxID=3827 RepID=A0A1S2XQF0_CICAR|nr:transcription factor bHLH18-like isoform X2 [Cicer arietinum]